MRQQLISPSVLPSRVSELNHWTNVESVLHKRFAFKTFAESIAFVNELAQYAEELDHHPDIDIRFNVVALTLSTHDSGGVTDLDIQMAQYADSIESRLPAQ